MKTRSPKRRLAAKVVGLVVLFGCSVLPLAAQDRAAGDFDIRGASRLLRSSEPSQLSLGQAQSLEALRQQSAGDLRVQWSVLTGGPSRIHRSGTPLTAPSAAAPRDIAQAFLREHLLLFKLTQDDIGETRWSRDYITRHNDVTHLTLQQQIQGIDVFGGHLKVNIDAVGRIINVSGEPMPGLRAAVNSFSPDYSVEALADVAARSVGVASPSDFVSDGQIYFPIGPGEVRLAWRFRFSDPGSADTYDTIVDAMDGRVLWRKNLTSYDHFPAHGTVYTSDDPIPNTPMGTSTPSPRQDVPFNGGDFFPHDDPHYDWWDGATRDVSTSNNVDAYEDRDGDNAPGARVNENTPGGEDFFFAIDLTMEPVTYTQAAIANLFYWNNRLHDWFYQMGFDEGAGNFQENNFGLGGSGGDSVLAEAQDNADGDPPSKCNANFNTNGPDGTNPRMQMFECDRDVVPQRDSDLDNVVIGHEYGHGVHSRLVPTSGNQRGNEGWSDYFGLSVVAESGDPYDGAYGVGNWFRARNGDGIRSDPYSTDLGIYKRTYADINDASTFCQVKTCSDDDTEVCTKDEDCGDPETCDTVDDCKFHEDCEPPNTPISQGPCRSQVHRTGELWANSLWNMRMRLIYKWGYQTGDDTSNKLVIDGMKMSPDDPHFLDGRDAILAADLVNNGGVNQCLIWDAFAKMGMGASAVTTDVLDLNPIEGFDIPTGCSPIAQINTTTDMGAVCQGGSLTSQLRVFNTGGGDLIISGAEVTSGSSDITIDPSPTPPVFISADAHVDFTVICTPSGAGSKTATITLETNDTAQPTIDIEYSCQSGVAVLSTFIADSGAFGNVCAGDIKDLNLTVQNNGTCDLEIDSVSLSGDDDEFELPDGSLAGTIIEAGNSLLVPVRFAPDNFLDAPRTASVDVSSRTVNGASLPLDQTPISGDAPPPDINQAIANSGDFGAVCKGDQADLDLTLFNQGMCDLTISDIEVVPDAGSFELPADLTLPLVLSPDADFTVPVRFSPDTCFDAPEMRTVKVTSDDPDEPMVNIGVGGVAPCPNLVIDPGGLTGLFAFPATVVDTGGTLGCFSEQGLNLRNNSVCPLTITSVTAAGLDFLVTDPTVFPILLPGGEETLGVTVRFLPQADADPLAPSQVSGQLTVVSDDPDGAGLADLCGESVAQSGVRILVTDQSGEPPLAIDNVDSMRIRSHGIHTPGPVNLSFTDQPLSSAVVCGKTIDYHVDQETLPATDTSGNNPKSSYKAKAQEGNLQTEESFTLGQCEFREFQLQLEDADSPVCLLLPKGAPCTTDGECCSGKCKGQAGSKTCK